MHSRTYSAFAALLMAMPFSAPAHADAHMSARDGSRLLAAAEPFAQITASAFTKSFADLKTEVTGAVRTAHAMQNALASNERPYLDVDLVNLRIALHHHARGHLARAAITCYRRLVAAIPAKSRPPRSAALMDYAGYRYDADLHAMPVHWQDMTGASAVARANWDRLAPHVHGADLRFRLEEAVNGMQIAASGHNARLAKRSATLELHLVGQARKQFASHTPPVATS